MLGRGRGKVVIIGMRGEPAAAEASITLQQPEVHHVFSQGTCPWITGPWQWPVEQIPVGCVDSDLCLHTEFLVVAVAALVFHVHLWSSFRQCSAFCGQTGKEFPLLVHPETMISCLLSRSRLFPRLPASCGTLAPFRLCSRSQPQSCPWDLTSEA